MKTKYYIFFLFIAILAVSCENDIPYKSKDVEPKLTMNAFINTDSLTNTVLLNLTGKYRPGHVDKATVEIYINGELKETAEEMPPIDHEIEQKRYLVKSRFNPGDKVRIEARTDDGKYHVWAEETVPHPVEIIQLDTINVPLGINDWYSYLKKLRIRVKFIDRPDETNYYRLAVTQNRFVKFKTPIGETTLRDDENWFWSWDDWVLTEGQPVTTEEMDNELFERIENRYGVFDDSMFTNNEYTMNVQAWIREYFFYDYEKEYEPLSMDVYLTVRLVSITESGYYYLKALNYLDSDIFDDYINDPIQIPSNVRNGLGIVEFSSENGVTIPIMKDHRLDYSENEWRKR